MPTYEGSMHLIQNKTGKLVLFRLGERMAIRVCLELSNVFSFVMLFMLAPVKSNITISSLTWLQFQ